MPTHPYQIMILGLVKAMECQNTKQSIWECLNAVVEEGCNENKIKIIIFAIIFNIKEILMM